MAYVDSKVKSFLEVNRKVAETWKKPPMMEQIRAASLKAGGMIILTCLDPRSVPEQFFGPATGAAVFRNAGGRATKDAITSITLLRSLANAADCGATHLTDEGVRKDAKARTPDAADIVDATDSYGCYDAADFDETIKVDVRTLRNSKVLAGMDIRGLALDTETGLVRELDV